MYLDYVSSEKNTIIWILVTRRYMMYFTEKSNCFENYLINLVKIVYARFNVSIFQIVWSSSDLILKSN